MDDKTFLAAQWRLALVESRIRFFGSQTLRHYYTSLIRELEDERRTLRASLADALQANPALAGLEPLETDDLRT